jgi:hypothetical protein
MVYHISELLGFWTFSIVWYFRNQKTQHFRNWIYFRPQVLGGKTPTQFYPLDRANLNRRTETDPVSEKSCFLVTRITEDGKVQTPPNSESLIHISETNIF